MNNTLVKYEELTPEQLLVLTGQAQAPSSYEDFPRVTINKLGEDEQERAIPVGSYAVSQNGKAVYGKPIYFRPFLNAYQYSVYDGETNTYVNKSVIFKNFGEEAIDEKGGVACGRISAKKREGLSEQQLTEQKKIKCYRLVYGLVSFDGVTADNEKVSILNLPVKFRLSGDNFMPIQEAFDVLSKKKLSMLNYNLILGTQRKKKGTNVYYQMTVEIDDKHIPIIKEEWEALKDFQAAIDKENKQVIEKHNEALKAVQADKEDKATLLELENELNDDISDIG